MTPRRFLARRGACDAATANSRYTPPVHAFLALLAACEPGDPPDSEAADRCGPVLQADYDCEDVTSVATIERTMPAGIPVTDVPVGLAVGDLAGSGTPQLYVGTNTTLTRLDGEGWATVTDLWVHASGKVVPLLADLTADGITDLVLGLPQSDDGAGQVLLFPGPVTGPLDWDSPHVELQGEHGEGGVLHAADLDGDGILDLAVGSSVVFGPVLEDRLLGGGADVVFDKVHLGVGDVTGDGVADLLFVGEDPDVACETAWRDQPLVVPGPLAAGQHDTWESALRLGLPAKLVLHPYFPATLADADGDGGADVVAFAVDLDYTVALWPMALVWPGPVAHGVAPRRRLGGAWCPTGDIDGDGMADALGGEPGDDAAPASLVYLGPLVDRPGVDPATCTVAADERWLSAAIQESTDPWVGELDGDGRPDVVSAVRSVDGEDLVYVVLGAGR